MFSEVLTPDISTGKGPVPQTTLFNDLANRSATQLETAFWQGITPNMDDLVGWDFKGWNHPEFISYLGFRKFIKGFFDTPVPSDPDDPMIEGYNLELIQNGPTGPWLGNPSDEAPKRHGYYHVYKVRPHDRDNKYPHALLLNYGTSPRNPAIDITKVLRDYLVQPDPDNKDVFLGKAYVALGNARIAVSFFLLERLRENRFSVEESSETTLFEAITGKQPPMEEAST